jgi:hypothetical protein
MMVIYHSIESKADEDVTKIRYEEGRQEGTGIQVNHLLSTMVVPIQLFSYHLIERKEETAQHPWGRGGGGDYDFITTACIYLCIYILRQSE